MYSDHGWYWTIWRRLLPSHPEVVAAHVLPQMQKTHLYGPGTVLGAFIDLTAGDGPFAEAIALCLAQGVTQRRTERADAAMLTLAARGDLPADRLGRQLGRLARAGEVRPGGGADALERAVEGGAYAGVWRILAAALPVLCPEPGERPAHGRSTG
ncbi:hypothetical protein [Actinomadura madurae]|uniref:hypothetical protein n=2 Tax=Actinomadura madurae TaxID=1993 RepID=UPI0020D24B38|nr:hypothetical protein [Actinomadura madurae]MCQ0005866.1 hypothetical protein [Actinomadura madurae]